METNKKEKQFDAVKNSRSSSFPLFDFSSVINTFDSKFKYGNDNKNKYRFDSSRFC
jgi:hypothetical protein